eukprot:TRINITY_DN69486_c0_g1_i1.p1 TRINITY_DN69486_c0_g1~~TRINITY_DN69486_c0_g1_i1.p1  ORF type:complete len:334 (+),score=41.08 TRINITY_DN69486_c0_g1_i1:74-1075(+)
MSERRVSPQQETMSGNGDPSAASAADASPVLLSGAGSPSQLATLGYVAVAAGHLWILSGHAAQASSGESAGFFAMLAVIEAALAYESALLAIGGFSVAATGSCLPLLSFAGRVKLLGAAMAWPWLMPWTAELSCRCGRISVVTGTMMLHHTLSLAIIITLFFVACELSFAVWGEPPSALAGGGAAAPPAQIGDCLPSQAVLGGHFRLDKADLEETGRAIFVPARKRTGLYVGAGLAVLSHLIAGFAEAPADLAAARPPWILIGAIVVVLGRRWGELPKLRARGEEKGDRSFSPWRREGPRLITRAGELVWMFCCVMELQKCEAQPSWLASCQP